MTGSNLRVELNAYTRTNACRLAALLDEHGKRMSRDVLAEQWAERYPQHAEMTGRKNVRSRIKDGLFYLKVAGIVEVRGDEIIVLDQERLRMSAANLAIIQDVNDQTINPGRWHPRPAVPKHLELLQKELEQRPPQSS